MEMNNDIITVYEDVQSKIPLTEDQKKSIILLKTLWGSQNLILQADGNLLMKHYVGFVVSGETRIQILPKIYKTSFQNDEKESEESCRLLFRLLAYSGYLSVKDIPKPQTISGCKSDLLEIFIGIFISKFLKFFISDPNRGYEVNEDNIQFIKGKILFEKSILKNMFSDHMHYVEYEEFTVNTVLNRIFKTVLLRLLHASRSSNNKIKIKLALVYLEDVDTIRLSKSVFDRIRFNRLNKKYEPLYNFCKLFYYNRQPGFKNGDENTFNFLVPLNKLFEFYLFKILEGSKLTVEYQKPQEYLGKYNGSGIFLLKPDITLIKDKKVEIILDAKYKRIGQGDKPSVKQADIYQMVDYAGHYNCRKVFLVYPVCMDEDLRDEPIIIKIKLFNNDISIKIIQIDIMEEDVEKVGKKLLQQISIQ